MRTASSPLRWCVYAELVGRSPGCGCGLRDHGPGVARWHRPAPGPPGSHRRRHPHDGPGDRGGQGVPEFPALSRQLRTPGRPSPTSGRPGPPRTACWPLRSWRSRCLSGGAIRRSSRLMGASGPRPLSRCWPSSARPSVPRGRSLWAAPPRSPTGVVNVNGGAVSLGHPIGASGNRIALSLLHEPRSRGGGLGIAALCGGGGQGDALVVRSIS
jgi:Thiolase, C-terminal domain